MTKSELITQIGYRIRTSSRNFVTATEIETELNRSLDRLNGLADITASVQTTTITFTGDGNYALPSDFKRPISLFDRTNNMLYKLVSKSELFEIEDGYGPAVYSPSAVITPTNSYAISASDNTVDVESVVDSATLTLTYYSTYDAKDSGGTLQKGLSANSDEPLLQPRFHDYFVEDVSAIIFRKERKYDDYQVARQERDVILREIYDENPTREERIITMINTVQENWN